MRVLVCYQCDQVEGVTVNPVIEMGTAIWNLGSKTVKIDKNDSYLSTECTLVTDTVGALVTL